MRRQNLYMLIPSMIINRIDHFTDTVAQPQPHHSVIYSLEIEYSLWNFDVFHCPLMCKFLTLQWNIHNILKNNYTVTRLRLSYGIREVVYWVIDNREANY